MSEVQEMRGPRTELRERVCGWLADGIGPVLVFFGIYVTSAIVAEAIIVAVLLGSGVSIRSDEIPRTLLTQTAPLYGFAAFALGTVGYWRLIRKGRLADLGASARGSGREYLFGLFFGTLLVSSVTVLSIAARVLLFRSVGDGLTPGIAAVMLGGYLIQGASEELMTRGFLLQALEHRLSLAAAVLISSLVFSTLHAPSLLSSGGITGAVGFLNTVLFSVLMSLVFIQTGRIWVVAGIHSAWNYLLAVVMGVTVSGGVRGASALTFDVTGSQHLFTGGAYGLEAGIVTTVVLLGAVTATASVRHIGAGQPRSLPGARRGRVGSH